MKPMTNLIDVRARITARLAPVALVLVLATLLTGSIAQAQSAEPPTAPPGRHGDFEYEMVLIHGLGSAASVWDGLAPYLKGTFKVYLFELSGHGLTQPILDPSIEKEAERLAEFLSQNQITYPTLVGHGMGGLIALRFCLDNPNAAHRLIMMDTAPKQLASKERKTEAAEALATDYDRFVARQYLQMSPNNDVTEVILDQALKTDSASFISLLLSSFDFDMSDELRTLSVPLLVVGSEMLFPTPETSQDVLERIGFGRARSLSFKRLGRTGHYMMLEQPVYLASVLLAYGVTADHIFEPGY